MRAAPPTSKEEPVKIHYIWLPEVAPPGEDLRILGIGILVSWGLSYFGLTSLVDWVFDKLGRGTPWGWWIAATIASCSGPIAWIMFMKWLERGGRLGRRRRPRPSLWGTPGNIERSPHQLIELALRSEPQDRRRFFAGFKQIPAGEVIVAEWNWRGLRPHRPAGEVQFEPIGLSGDPERLAWLGRMDPREPTRDPGPRAAKRKPARPRPSFRQRPLLYLNRWIAIAYAVLFLVYWSFFPSPAFPWYRFYRYSLFLLGGVIIFALATAFEAWVVPLFYEHRWWLVPGGLVCRGFSFWRRGVDVKMFTPADTPLFLDARNATGNVLDGGRLLRFHYPKDDLPAVIAAWISRARTPSVEEARAFVGEGNS